MQPMFMVPQNPLLNYPPRSLLRSGMVQAVDWCSANDTSRNLIREATNPYWRPLPDAPWPSGVFDEAQTISDPTVWTTPEPTPPEPSPLDKALEDFVARRKDRRAQPGEQQEQYDDKAWDKIIKDRKDAESLKRAMSRLAPHDTDIHERLMPYRTELRD